MMQMGGVCHTMGCRLCIYYFQPSERHILQTYRGEGLTYLLIQDKLGNKLARHRIISKNTREVIFELVHGMPFPAIKTGKVKYLTARAVDRSGIKSLDAGGREQNLSGKARHIR